MTDLESGQAADVVTEHAGTEATADTRNYEAEAREMGWVPETEWKGDKKPKKFLSAEEFVERGETVIPILRKKLKEQEGEFADRLSRLEKMTDKTVAKLLAEHKKEVDALKTERRDAIKAGDVDAVERIDKRMDDLKAEDPAKMVEKAEEAKPAEKPKYVGEDGKPVPKEQVTWIEKNPWFTSEFDMNEYAVKISKFNAAGNPDISFEDNMKLVEAAVRKKFPDYFADKSGTDDKPAANGHAAVDGGGSFPGAVKSKATLYSKLPAEAKKMAEQDIAKGLYKTGEEWAKAYFS